MIVSFIFSSAILNVVTGRMSYIINLSVVINSLSFSVALHSEDRHGYTK